MVLSDTAWHSHAFAFVFFESIKFIRSNRGIDQVGLYEKRQRISHHSRHIFESIKRQRFKIEGENNDRMIFFSFNFQKLIFLLLKNVFLFGLDDNFAMWNIRTTAQLLERLVLASMFEQRRLTKWLQIFRVLFQKHASRRESTQNADDTHQRRSQFGRRNTRRLFTLGRGHTGRIYLRSTERIHQNTGAKGPR